VRQGWSSTETDLSKAISFIKTTILGGLVVLLPAAILIIVFRWVYGLIEGAIRPLTRALLARQDMQDFLAVLIVLGIIILTCFIIGLIIRTQIGKFIHGQLEDRILRFAPGYSLIKETVRQFLGRGESPFAQVAFVQLFDSDTMCLGFVTERHENGWFAVFVPTAPNPTSGLIYHVKPEHVHIVKHPIEDVMRSIISCGAGSADLMRKLEESRREVVSHEGPKTRSIE
jgi:uncharacterized membrane protein